MDDGVLMRFLGFVQRNPSPPVHLIVRVNLELQTGHAPSPLIAWNDLFSLYQPA
jgi:hypothetical protein